MVITRTPFRMSFFGGGTDMEEYFRKNGGAVISSTFDKYCYVNVRHLPRFFDYETEIIYHDIERVSDLDSIIHPLVRNAMKFKKMQEIHLVYDADLPARSGLGTSSSFAVGMLHAFYAMKGKQVDKERLADEAIYLERVLCKEAGGWQDQIAASYGGLNRIDFFESGYTVSPIIISKERKQQLNDHLMLFFTGFTRISSNIQKQNMRESTEDKNALLREMHQMVDEAERILINKNVSLDEFGALLGDSWELKHRTSGSISTPKVDAYYRRGIEAGALGGKLLGAGGGGFLLFYVPKDYQDNVKKALSDLMLVPFEFENEGTKVVLFTQEEYTLRGDMA